MTPARIRRLAILTLLTASMAAGQASTAAPLTFEVASVKVAAPGGGSSGGCHGIDFVTRPGLDEPLVPLGRCVITGSRLSHLIAIAYGVSLQDLKTGPDWMQRGDLRFDINAKAEDPAKATQKELLTMLQNLLVERFRLKFHYESSETPGFILTVAKGGPKLRESVSEKTQTIFKSAQGESVFKPDPRQAMSLTARKYSVRTLVELLSAVGQSGPGVDRTGLSGEYDFTLAWDNEGGPVLSTALRQQLGLQMKSEKVPISTFVVDSAEKPSTN